MMARHRSPAVRLLLLPNKQMHLNAPSWAVCVSDAVLLSQSGSVRIGSVSAGVLDSSCECAASYRL
jgi:hypothetical protein